MKWEFQRMKSTNRLCEINTYDGEYTLLPMAGVALGVQFATLPLSPENHTVFISAHL